MKLDQKRTYTIYIRSIVLLLMIGQLWVNIISPLYVILDNAFDLTEISINMDGESEEENTKVEDDKITPAIFSPKIYIERFGSSTEHAERFAPIHHPEITTPPPELWFS